MPLRDTFCLKCYAFVWHKKLNEYTDQTKKFTVVKASYSSCVYFNYPHRCYVVQNSDFDMSNLKVVLQMENGHWHLVSLRFSLSRIFIWRHIFLINLVWWSARIKFEVLSARRNSVARVAVVEGMLREEACVVLFHL